MSAKKVSSKASRFGISPAGLLLCAIWDRHLPRFGAKNLTTASRRFWAFRVAVRRWRERVQRDWDAKPLEERASFAGLTQWSAFQGLAKMIEEREWAEFDRITATPKALRTYRAVTKKLARKRGGALRSSRVKR